MHGIIIAGIACFFLGAWMWSILVAGARADRQDKTITRKEIDKNVSLDN